MYQYSLVWFINLYKSAIDNTERVEEVNQRLIDLQKFFTYSLYVNICRSLFEKDKILFSLLLVVNLLKSKNEIEISEWMFLLTGGVGLENPHPNPCPWMIKKSWDEICRLDDLPNFKYHRKPILFDQSYNNFVCRGLMKHVRDNSDKWKVIFDSGEPQHVPLPDPWNTKLNPLQKLIVLRCIRYDKIVPGVQDFIVGKCVLCRRD